MVNLFNMLTLLELKLASLNKLNQKKVTIFLLETMNQEVQ